MSRKRQSAWRRAEQAGMDMSLVEANLRLSVPERLYRHDRALNTAWKLRAAVQKRNEKAH